jgi:hypothetical protein
MGLSFNVRRLLYSDIGQIMISIVLGFGLASLFRRACRDRSCLKFVGPEFKRIDGKIFHFDKRCYKYKPVARYCDKNKKQVQFHDEQQI